MARSSRRQSGLRPILGPVPRVAPPPANAVTKSLPWTEFHGSLRLHGRKCPQERGRWDCLPFGVERDAIGGFFSSGTVDFMILSAWQRAGNWILWSKSTALGTLPGGWIGFLALVGYPSGQRGQTVNLLAHAFSGSNPEPTTIFFQWGNEIFSPLFSAVSSSSWFSMAALFQLCL